VYTAQWAEVQQKGEEEGMPRVLVVDHRADFRQAFAAVLNCQPDLEVVAQAGSLAEARTMLVGVDVAHLDRGLPDGDGLKLMWPLREANPEARVLVMSATAEMRHPEDAIEAGADEVIGKLGPFERMFATIRGDGAAREPSRHSNPSV
jgi:two-component system response regulator DesR